MNTKQQFLALALSLCALIAGHSAYQLIQHNSNAKMPAAPNTIKNNYQLIGQTSPAFQLPDIHGKLRSSSEWQGKTLLINFWATWCAPCRKEIPDLIEVQKALQHQNVQIIGIAIDRPEMVYEFAQEYKINYPLLYGEQNAMALNEQFGNKIGALPYTVSVNKHGIIQAIHDRGILTKTIIEKMLSLPETSPVVNN